MEKHILTVCMCKFENTLQKLYAKLTDIFNHEKN